MPENSGGAAQGGAATPASRSVGVGMLVAAFLAWALNAGLSKLLGLYFPFLLVPAGPLLTMGCLTLVYPRSMDLLLDRAQGPLEGLIKAVAWVFLMAGLVLGVLLFASFRGDLG